MIGKVIKPIPGTGYSIGDMARFDEKEGEEWEKLGYLERSTPETATVKPAESAALGKPGKKPNTPHK